jgi:hypothetical protein
LRDFDVTYEVGRSYHLTVGVIGNGGGMSNGVTMELSLYYRDGTNTPTVSATTVTNSAATFGGRTNLIDYSVHTPAVKAGDPWAGKKIGIRFVSTEFVYPYGYWDLDNVRLGWMTFKSLCSERSRAPMIRLNLPCAVSPG